MSGIELTLTTLRRTHFTLIAVALLLLVLTRHGGRDYDRAMDEVHAVRALVSPDVIDRICLEAAQQRFSEVWRSTVAEAFEDPGRVLSRNAAANFTAYCPPPGASWSLAEIANYLQEGLLVDVPRPAEGTVGPLMARIAPTADLQEAFVLWDTALVGRWSGQAALARLANEKLTAIDSGADSLDVRLTYSAPVDPRLLFPPTPPVGDTADVGSEAPRISARLLEARHVVAARVPGTIYQSRWPTERIIESSARWDVLVGSGEGDSPAIFPDLQPFWSEVSSLSPDDARVYLNNLAREELGRIQIMGLVIPTRTLGWAGPVIPLVIVLYLLLNLQHLRRIAGDDPTAVRRFPWLGVFDDPPSLAVMAITVLVLPAIPALLLAMRLWTTSLDVALWSGALGLLSGAAGVWTLLLLEKIRQAVRV